MGLRVLAVDDEKLIVKGLKFALEQDGMDVDCAYDGEEALSCIKNGKYDVVLLDLMLPKLNGYQVCQQVREFSDIPIIMLTARDDDMDKIMGLEYGADDYITKPFNVLEVKARIRAIVRRNKMLMKHQNRDDAVHEITVKDLRIEVENKRVFLNDMDMNLTSKEFDLLYFLASNPNKVYDREKLLKLVWGQDNTGDARTVDVHVRRLREKIESDPKMPQYIYTKWGMGYYFHG
ncbi:MAG: response regulator transcription factor [Clostridiales bacterium]|nr:response regulator transcription factor [Clostridiales bacterium]